MHFYIFTFLHFFHFTFFIFFFYIFYIFYIFTVLPFYRFTVFTILPFYRFTVLPFYHFATEAVGLGIHPDKTKILSNQVKVKAKEIDVENIKVEILGKAASARYLGQKITFEDQETEEIKNRLKAAWAAFHKYRQELTSKDYRLCHRLRLFNMVVTPTMTYASSTWTLTLKHEKMIKTAQRKMLRLIVQTERRYKPKKVKMDKKRRGHRKSGRKR